SLTLALVLVLSLSALAFADTAPTAEIPADTMQAFIDDTPEGYYLAGTKVVPINDDFTAYEAIYKPLIEPRASTTSGSKVVYVEYKPISANVIKSSLMASFSYDGSTSTCTSVTASTSRLNGGVFPGYTISIVNSSTYRSGNHGYVDLVYNVLVGSAVYDTISNVKPTIACDPYGNIY
ncbi:MAG: hypothetical protein IKU17_00950, partial [Clostridia bacterium]|nr:hypothetical protein [Clostridia bacterium]